MRPQLIRATKGRFFTATFVKKNGEIRKMNARIGVAKNLKGTGLSFDPLEKGLMVVWDLGKRAYRMINLSTVLTFKCGQLEWIKK